VSSLSLAAYQDAFAAALLADDPAAVAPSLRDLVRQSGFSVYRNTVLAGCVDALEANYPTIARLVGEEWFRATAGVHARERLPQQASLLLYGEDFPEFLATFPPARELPYLAAVARVDRAWTEAHVAADEEPLAPAVLAGLSPADLACHTVRVHAAARWVWSDEWPIHSLWTRHRTPEAHTTDDIVWSCEGVLLTRPSGTIRAFPLAQAGVAFLEACSAGASLEHAVAAVLDLAPAADLASLIEQLLLAGALGSLAALQDPEHQSTEKL
jgi:hypothetical protein